MLTAERLKIERGFAGRAPGREPYVVAGTDMRNLRPGKRAVDETLVGEAMHDAIDRIARAAWSILEACPPDLAGELMEAGIVLTGGGALCTASQARSARARTCRRPSPTIRWDAWRAAPARFLRRLVCSNGCGRTRTG